MALCFGLLLMSVGAFAQGQFGTLTGSIFDPSGAVVPAADITITNMDTGANWTVKGSSAGYYSLPVPPGKYQVEARQEGFKGSLAKDIVVPVAQVVTIDLTLQVGSPTQSVTVTSQAPLLTPSTAELSNALSPKEFATFPLPLEQSGRSVMAFIYSSVPGAVGNDYNGSLNGGQYFTANILMDGLSIANYNASGTMQPQASPSPDAISEFKVQTSSYSAEYGNTSGGIVNYSMKAGTNQFHGSVYEYFKNPVLNATGWDTNQLPAGSLQKIKSPTRQNNFGVGLGGPIRKNKTFFFFNYEGNRLQGGSAVNYTTVPTTEMLKGDFSQWLWNQVGTDALGRPVYSYEIYDPTSTRSVPAGAADSVTGLVNKSGSTALIRDAFGFDPVTGTPGSNANVIPGSYFSVASAKLLSAFPTPINAQLGNNEVGHSGDVNFPLNKWSLKIDQNIGSKHKIAASWAMSDTSTLWGKSGVWWEPAPSYPLDPMKISSTPYRMFRLSEDWAINDHTMNHFAIGIDRTSSLNGQAAGNVNGWSASDLGITGVNTQHPKIPEIDMSSFAPPSGHPAAGKAALLTPFGSWQSSTSFDTSDGYIPYSDTFSYVRGKHSLKFGTELTRYRAAERDPGPLKFGFSYLQTSLPGVYQKQTGHPFASFLLGAANTGTLGVSTTTPGFRQGVYSFYAQDDWRATPKLTVSYGLRWEIPLPQTEAYDRMSALDPTEPNPGADNYPGSLAFLGNCQGCTHTNAFQKTYYDEFAPRLGLAYQATRKMVWRGGYGISYAPPIANGWPGATAGFNSSVNFASTSLYPREFLNPADPAIFWSQLTNAAQLPSWYGTNGRIGVPPFTGTLPDRAPDSMNYQSIQYNPPSLAMPYTQNWNAGFQYMLPADILFEANYVGAKGTRLIDYPLGQLMDDAPTKYMGLSQYGDYLGDDIDADLANPAAAAVLAKFGITSKPFPSFTGAVADSLRPYPQFSSINNTFANFGNSTYNARK